MAISAADKGRVKIGNWSLEPYQKAFRGKIDGLHELDAQLQAKGQGGAGISALDNTYSREAFRKFYDDAFEGLQALEAAVDKALAIPDIYKPEERQKRQLALILEPLQNVLKWMFNHLKRFREDREWAEAVTRQAAAFESSAKGEAIIIEELRAQEIRATLRGLSEEDRSEILRSKTLEAGDLFALAAAEADPLGLVRADTLNKIRADFVIARARWLLDMVDDKAYLSKQAEIRAQLIQGLIFAILKKGDGVKLPNVSPWNDGRFFSIASDGAFILRLPQVPEGYLGATVDPPEWRANDIARFALKMAV